VPAHGWFEFHHAVLDLGIQDPKAQTRWPSDEHPIDWHLVFIDDVFIELYFDRELPKMKAGDLIFVALAKGEGRTLITEDGTMLKEAKRAGVEALTIQEYLDMNALAEHE
jgi:hypothetical protein